MLQSAFARHPEIYTFPETRLLLKALGKRAWSKPLSWLGLSLGKEWAALRASLEKDGQNLASVPAIQSIRLSLTGISRALDEITLEQNKFIWLEKTPKHYYRAACIPKYFPNSHVIHIVREGTSVVASLIDRAKTYSGSFKRQTKPAYAISQWNLAVARHTSLLGMPNHSFLLFEDFVASPQAQLTRLCNEAGIEFNSQMIETGVAASRHIKNQEPWKEKSAKAITPPKDKFNTMFDKETRKKISGQLDHKRYSEIRAHIRATR